MKANNHTSYLNTVDENHMVTTKKKCFHTRRTFDDVSGGGDNCCRVPIAGHIMFEEDSQALREFEYGEVSLSLICDRIAQIFGMDLDRLEVIAEEKGEQNT